MARTRLDDGNALRSALGALHRRLLIAQQIETERRTGRMTSGEVLQASIEDPRFEWLKQVSQLMVALDIALAEKDSDEAADVVERTKALLAVPDPETQFGRRYLRALQEDPDVVFAHRDVIALIS